MTMHREPRTYADLRAIVDSDRAAMTAAAVLPELPADESVLVVDTDGRADSPPRNERARHTDTTDRERFLAYADPIAGMNLYRVHTKNPSPLRRAGRTVYGAYDVDVFPQPHPTHAPYHLSHGDITLVDAPHDDVVYDIAPQTTLSDVTGPPHVRTSHLPI